RLGPREHLTLACRDTADILDDRVEAPARRPWPHMAERAERDIDDAGAQRRQLLGRQAATGERPRPVALREDIALADQPLQGFEILRLAQIEPRRQFAVPGVVFLVVARGDG